MRQSWGEVGIGVWGSDERAEWGWGGMMVQEWAQGSHNMPFPPPSCLIYQCEQTNGLVQPQ